MANTHNARGFVPIRGYGGNEPRLRRYKANVTTDIFRGDLVSLATAGTVFSTVTTTGSATVVGVAANRIKHGDSTTSQDIWVYDDPNQDFELQDDGAAATPSQASVGATAVLIMTTGNTTTGISKQELDASGLGVAATDAVIIEGFKTGPTFTIGKYASHIVRINRHLWKTSSAGI